MDPFSEFFAGFGISPTNYAFLFSFALTSALMFFVLLHFVLVYFQNRFIPEFASLDRKNKLHWNNCVLSDLHSVTMATVGWFLMLWYPEYRSGDIFHAPTLTSLLEAFSIGYFLNDTIYLLFFPTAYQKLQWRLFLLHHIAGLMLISGFLWNHEVYSLGFVICACVETTGPFANNIYFLKQFGLRESFVFTVNGVLLLITWVFCRWVVGGGFGWWFLIRSYREGTEYSVVFYWFLLVEQCLGTTLNLIWGWKIVNGFVQVVLGRPLEAVDSKNTEEKKWV